MRAGHETDTVAAITGALVGDRYGVSGLPATWRRRVHGWPGLRGREVVELALRTAGECDDHTWPARDHEVGDHAPLEVPVGWSDRLTIGNDLSMRQMHALIRAWRPRESRAESTLIQETIEDLQSFVYNTDEPISVQLEPRPWFGQPLLHERRGNPRATVEAVNDGLKYFGGTSKGVQGLLRAAPLCALALISTADELKETVSLSVSLTHDTHYVANPAILFCQPLARLATSPTTECLDVIVNLFSEALVTKVDDYFTTAGGEVDLDLLRTIAANGRAHRVLAAAMYLATCDAELDGAIGFAGETADADGVAAVAGALIGASTGVTP